MREMLKARRLGQFGNCDLFYALDGKEILIPFSSLAQACGATGGNEYAALRDKGLRRRVRKPGASHARTSTWLRVDDAVAFAEHLRTPRKNAADIEARRAGVLAAMRALVRDLRAPAEIPEEAPVEEGEALRLARAACVRVEQLRGEVASLRAALADVATLDEHAVAMLAAEQLVSAFRSQQEAS